MVLQTQTQKYVAMKLDGIRVIDLSTIFPGPYLTMHLAQHGADVLKIEAPGEGDAARQIGARDGEQTVLFRTLNSKKRCVTLDLKSDQGRAELLRLVDGADVVVESFRPGAAERLGASYKTLSARNPRLVYCSITGFGQDGPYRDRPGHDLAVQAISGALSLNLGDGGEPTLPALLNADLLGGLHGLAGVLMALLRRQTTGRGDYIDISMLDCMINGMQNVVGPTFADGAAPNVKAQRSTGGSAFYQIYKTSDGRRLVLSGQAKKFVEALLEGLGRPDLTALCLQGPGPHQQPVIDFLRSTFAQRTRVEWEAYLNDRGVSFAPVNTLPEAFADAQVRARGVLHRNAGGLLEIVSPIRFLDEPSGSESAS